MLWRIYRSAYAGLPREIWILSAVALVNRSGMMVLPFLTLYLTRSLGFEMGLVGQLLAAYGLGAALGVQLGGWLTDRLGSLRVQAASLFLAGPLFLALGELRSAAGLTAALFALSVVCEAFRPASQASLTNHCPAPQRARAFGLYRMAVNLGVTIGPVVGGVLAVRDYSWLFRVNAFAWLAAGVLLVILGRGWQPLPEREGSAPDVRAASRSPWRDGPFLVAVGCSALVSVVFLQTQSTFMVYLGELERIQEDKIGMLLAINTVMVVLIEMPLIARLPARQPLVWVAIGSLLTGVGFGLMPHGSGLAFFGLTIAVWTMGEILSTPMLSVFVAERSNMAQRGRYMGLFYLSFALANIAAPLLGTWVWERFGPHSVWHASIGAACVAALGFAALSRRQARLAAPSHTLGAAN
ncbi:MAG: MFS transporter [Planctomycetaceae bacterium]|nr:MFS transporter [Planctomycetaceae bacterium]